MSQSSLRSKSVTEGGFGVWEEISIIGVLLKNIFLWRPQQLSHSRPLGFNWRPQAFHQRPQWNALGCQRKSWGLWWDDAYWLWSLLVNSIIFVVWFFLKFKLRFRYNTHFNKEMSPEFKWCIKYIIYLSIHASVGN